jgi:dCTP deaminase
VILSDVSIRKALSEGTIVIDPLDDAAIQPSSVDLRVDRYFRVFRNDTTPYIDPKQPQENLTELVEVKDDNPFILHPGEFVLGSTLERVQLPDNIVARLEGKSSLGRLGLLIHSSLPASEPVLVRIDDHLETLPIGDIVGKHLDAQVVGFDPETFEVSYHDITGWYEGPADRIYEICLGSGRRVRVTAGHNLFTLDRDGEIAKVRTASLVPGTKVAVPRRIPDPSDSAMHAGGIDIDVIALLPESAIKRLTVSGAGVRAGWSCDRAVVNAMLKDSGRRHVEYYWDRSRLPLEIALQVPAVLEALRDEDRIGVRGGRGTIPLRIELTADLAWLLGLYVAEGSHRRHQVTFSNTDQAILDRVERELDKLGISVSRAPGAVTACSSVFEMVIDALEVGDHSVDKRIPRGFLSLPAELLRSLFDGIVDGDGSIDDQRTSVWTSSPGLVADLLLMGARLGRRAGSCFRQRTGAGLFQVYFPEREHKLLTSVPLPDRLLIAAREQSGLRQNDAALIAGYSHASDLNNLERRRGRDAVRFATLRRLRLVYGPRSGDTDQMRRLDRLVDGDLLWDEVIEVRDTGCFEPIFDIEVRPDGRHIENFVAGAGGVLVSNTAGFVDAGWNGYLTLELSNVANLPIAIYPGMKIGQISFLQMTTSAETPYGSGATGSKYQGQRGPTPSRYYMNFRP